MHSANRLPVLDGLRAISILLVLAAHMLPLGPKSWHLNETAGAMGMTLFFALSGFLIASLLLQNDNVSEFLIKRFARILPLAFAYAVIVFTIIQFDPPNLLWTTSFLTNYVSSHLNGYNSHFWSLCVEIHFYLFMALVVLIAGSRGVWIVWPACLAITSIRIFQGAYIDIQTHLRVDEILAGSCLATLIHRSALKNVRCGYPTIALLTLVWVASSSPLAGGLQYLRPYASAGLLAAVLCQPSNYLVTIMSSAPLRYLATISYALYVIHQSTVQGWFNEGSVFDRYVLKRPISFAMTFALAHFSTFYWERYWQNLGRRFIDQRRL